jgi:hypothetical protein
LYQIRGDTELTATASQVEAKAHSLNSADVYVLEMPAVVWIWQGKGSNAHERKNSTFLVDRVQEQAGSKVTKTIEEGNEPAEFWEALGGKTHYINEPHRKSDLMKARLFQCTAKTGVFKVIEVVNFSQDDLDDDDIMLLDTYREIFVWIGARSKQKASQLEMSKEIAQEYVEMADDGRDKDCAIYVIDAGQEPMQFTSYFKGWNSKQATTGEDLYYRRLSQLKTEGAKFVGVNSMNLQQRRPRIDSAGPTPDEKMTISADAMTKTINPSGLIVDFDRLRAKPTPEGVNGANLEAYLSDEQFAKFVKMTRNEFYELPNWKQLRHKKSIGLF